MKKQIPQLKRSIAALARQLGMLSKAVDREQQLRKSLTTANSDSAASNATESSSGFYHGPVKFGLSQMKEAFVPTIYKVLESFPDCKHLGYCKVRLDRDVLRGVDYMAMRSYTVSELKGHQSAAVILKPWNGHKKMVCSVFIATRKDGHLVSDFTFEDMQVAEDTADLNGRDLFCSTVEDASESTQKPYLVIPTECTPEWRTSAGLPPEPYVHCGDQLTCTAGRIVGIHTAYEYISSAAQSATGIHVEDAFLGSANVVLAGAPKVWLIISPKYLEALEAKMEKKLAKGSRRLLPCSQFVRHLNALLSPKLLDEWMIPYQIVSCSAGEMIITLPGAYHQVVNAGANYAQAINFAMPDWSGPPDGYRFCGKGCAQTDPPTAEHFEIRAGKGTTGHEDEGGEEGKEDEEDEDGEEREEQEEDDSNECEKTRASGTDSINVLSNALVSLNMPTMEANMSGSDPFKTLHSYMAIGLTNPRKRNASLISANNEIEDDDGIRDEGNDSSSQASTEIAADPLSQVLQPEINYWRDCVFRAAQGGGFNADAILQALQNAPTTQPAVRVLRTLQCICEIANVSLLLNIRQQLLTDSAAAAAVAPPVTTDEDNNGGMHMLLQLHYTINTLRTISWVAQYTLAFQQVMYYQHFESMVQKRQFQAKRATNQRRNNKKRLINTSTSAQVHNEPRRPIRMDVIVKQEIVDAVTNQGVSRRVAEEDFKQYHQRGKILHLLLISANPTLLALFPLLESEERPPSLDLIAYEPPGGISDAIRRDLTRPIDPSW